MIFDHPYAHRENVARSHFARKKSGNVVCASRHRQKTLLSLSMGLAVASGSLLLRWQAPRQRRVLYVDGEMPLVSLQERLRAISIGLGAVIPNDGFRILAADNTENGLSIGSEEGQRAIDPLLRGVDLVIFDNLSTLCTNGSERCERRLGADAKVAAWASSQGCCCFACAPRRNQWSSAWHVAA